VPPTPSAAPDRAHPPKPIPVPDEASAGFWEATARNELAIQGCQHCGHLMHPPRTMCTGCQSTKPAFEWKVVSGRGRVRSWTTIRQALLPAFAADVPYTVAMVELYEQAGLIMTGQLHDIDLADITLDMPVRAEYTELSQGVKVPHFVPVTT